MARSEITTYLSLDDYAKIMGIPGWLFNQVRHPNRPLRGKCDMVWLQSGYSGDPNRITGRDELAVAISTAESAIARFLRFWLGNRWICADEVMWSAPRNHVQYEIPYVQAAWGYIHSGGIEGWILVHDNIGVTYSDPDDDGLNEWATITEATTITNKCEAVVVPHGYDPRTYAIRPLNVLLTGGVLTITGWRWLFAVPELWLKTETIELDDVDSFIHGGMYDDGVDIYRHYNDTSMQAQIVWRPGDASLCDGTVACSEVIQCACMRIMDTRNGIWQPIPARRVNGVWVKVCEARCDMPVFTRAWYHTGYFDELCPDCSGLSPSLREAIVRLANTYLPEAPCGCAQTIERWKRDREEMSIDSTNVELVQSAFGSTMRGAQFAHNTVSRIPPIG